MVEVPLTQGQVALIDDEDAERVLAYKWRATYKRGSKNRNWYAIRFTSGKSGVKRRFIKMHRFIMDAPPDMQVDHINHNGLDNRRCNLRLATRSQNNCNTTAPPKSPSGYRGVLGFDGNGKFYGQLKVDRRVIKIGPFDTAEDAARAYDLMAKHYHGEFATLNFRD